MRVEIVDVNDNAPVFPRHRCPESDDVTDTGAMTSATSARDDVDYDVTDTRAMTSLTHVMPLVTQIRFDIILDVVSDTHVQ